MGSLVLASSKSVNERLRASVCTYASHQALDSSSSHFFHRRSRTLPECSATGLLARSRLLAEEPSELVRAGRLGSLLGWAGAARDAEGLRKKEENKE